MWISPVTRVSDPPCDCAIVRAHPARSSGEIKLPRAFNEDTERAARSAYKGHMRVVAINSAVSAQKKAGTESPAGYRTISPE